eukprot:CAMPEP_0179130090 /NCGR_PEP_ID=MMETSP0796-20121207/61747_1 /TAXON_ID=73915 /ORGANISM="Pyrodinium bahamense, Strain pbaha01" /LENGTH=45 /DNA_ID= /DNA_START= /DNA_END= /DNA_ORIENTATION=
MNVYLAPGCSGSPYINMIQTPMITHQYLEGIMGVVGSRCMEEEAG